MSTAVNPVTLRMFTLHCCSCGIAYSVPDDFDERRRNDHQTFFCPSGHPQSYTGKSDVQRLREQVEAERQRANRAEEGRKWAEQSADGHSRAAGRARAALKRLTHRVNCGVCPHCQRTFKQLAAHIKTKHPEVTR